MTNELGLKAEIRRRLVGSTQKVVAQTLGVSPQFLNDVLLNRRAISENLAEALGYRRVVLFEEVK